MGRFGELSSDRAERCSMRFAFASLLLVERFEHSVDSGSRDILHPDVTPQVWRAALEKAVVAASEDAVLHDHRIDVGEGDEFLVSLKRLMSRRCARFRSATISSPANCISV